MLPCHALCFQCTFCGCNLETKATHIRWSCVYVTLIGNLRLPKPLTCGNWSSSLKYGSNKTPPLKQDQNENRQKFGRDCMQQIQRLKESIDFQAIGWGNAWGKVVFWIAGNHSIHWFWHLVKNLKEVSILKTGWAWAIFEGLCDVPSSSMLMVPVWREVGQQGTALGNRILHIDCSKNVIREKNGFFLNCFL